MCHFSNSLVYINSASFDSPGINTAVSPVATSPAASFDTQSSVATVLAPTDPLPVAAVSHVATKLAPIDSEPAAAMPSVANILIPTDPVPFAVSFQNVSPQCDSAPSCSKVISSNAISSNASCSKVISFI